MNDNNKDPKVYIPDDLKTASVLTPADSANKREYTPRDLNDAQLAALNHAEWLEQFSQTMGTGTAVQMTPFRQGVVSRAWWAARYIKLIERSLKRLEEENGRLKLELEGRDAYIDSHERPH